MKIDFFDVKEEKEKKEDLIEEPEKEEKGKEVEKGEVRNPQIRKKLRRLPYNQQKILLKLDTWSFSNLSFSESDRGIFLNPNASSKKVQMKKSTETVGFIDVNKQAGEVLSAEKMTTKRGESKHVVNPDIKEIEELFKKAEKGEIFLETLVISGHSTGTEFWGEGPGKGKSISYEELEPLKGKFPKAFLQVKRFIGLGCYTGTEYATQAWNKLFPNAIIIAGFEEMGPSGAASERFLKEVYNVTTDVETFVEKGILPKEKEAHELYKRFKKLKSMGVKSASGITTAAFLIGGEHGQYIPHKEIKDPQEVKDRINSLSNSIFEPCLFGEIDVPLNTEVSALREFYNLTHRAMGLFPQEKDYYKNLKEKAIRLIHYRKIKKNWYKSHEQNILKANNFLNSIYSRKKIPALDQFVTQSRPEDFKLYNELFSLTDNFNVLILCEFMKNQLIDLNVPSTWIA